MSWICRKQEAGEKRADDEARCGSMLTLLAGKHTGGGVCVCRVVILLVEAARVPCVHVCLYGLVEAAYLPGGLRAKLQR